MDVAARATISDADALTGTKVFEAWKKSNEHGMKLQMAVIDRLDGVIKSINGLQKTLARRG